jgi:membrane-associated phospholipid phosphatase
MNFKPLRLIGAVGTILFFILFIRTPSFPTPDKILVFATLVAMAFGQARELLKRFVPFVVLLLVYESFRGLVPELNMRVNYLFMPAADRFLFFGRLPTEVLQHWWWHGRVMWYDFVFYGAYTLHFVLPFALATVVWKTREKHYWRIVTAFLLVSFGGFLTYLAFPAAPPWLASDKGLIEPITRVSSHIFAAFGIHDFPSVYNKISPNPVAAMPSLHAAYSVLFALFVIKLFTGRWRWLAWVYPVLIMLGTVYMGEHYVIDALAGIAYAIAGYWASPDVLRRIQRAAKKIAAATKSVVK